MMQTPPPAPPPGLDWNLVLQQVTPLVGVVVLLVVAATVLRWVLRSPVGEALAERIRTRRGRGATALDEAGRVAALEEQVAQLSAHITELGERLDFAERLLAERRERTLGAGQSPRQH